jgi:hypothetical protein
VRIRDVNMASDMPSPPPIRLATFPASQAPSSSETSTADIFAGSGSRSCRDGGEDEDEERVVGCERQ